MKLTRDEIQFIDNYLIKSEVMFIDIRMEMLDHIATAVESEMQSSGQDFYDAFKQYMAQNKKELLAQNKMFSWPALKSAALFFTKMLVKPAVLVVVLAVFLALSYFLIHYGADEMVLIKYLNIALLAVMLLQLAITRGYRFSGLESLSLALALCYNMFHLIGIIALEVMSDNTASYFIFSTAFFLSLLPAYLFSVLKLKNQLTNRFLKTI